MSSHTKASFSSGDFVLLKGGKLKGQRGFILKESVADVFMVAVDELLPDYSNPEQMNQMPEMIDVMTSDLDLIRREHEAVLLRVCDYGSNRFSSLGSAAITPAPEIHIDKDSAFAKLKRVSIAELPGLHSSDTIFKDDDAGALCQDLYHGKNLVIELFHEYADAKQRLVCLPTIHAKLYVLEADETLLDVGSVTVCPLPDETSESLTGRDTTVSTTWGKLLKNGLTMDQKSALADRMIHIIFRSMGYNLGCNITKSICSYLTRQYANRRWWKESLDLAIIRADLVSVSPYYRYLPVDLPHIAECLQSCGKFHEAAIIYGELPDFYAGDIWKQIHTMFPNERYSNTCLVHTVRDAVHVLYQQGKAYTQCKEWESAEVSFLRVLRMFVQNSVGEHAFRDELFKNGFAALEFVYACWAAELRSGNVAELLNDVGSLLSAAKEASAINGDQGFNAVRFLGPRYSKSPREMKKALKRAFLTDSAATFRSAVCSWKRAGAKLPLLDCALTLTELFKTAAKADARDLYLERSGGGITHCDCANQDCGQHDKSKMFLCVQCKSARYWYVTDTIRNARHFP